jgi:hypothetical protein
MDELQQVLNDLAAIKGELQDNLENRRDPEKAKELIARLRHCADKLSASGHSARGFQKAADLFEKELLGNT